jgi:flagellar biosynthesis chaperone FliJ
MKKIVLGSALIAAAFLTGCENYKDELAQMTVTRDSLIAVSNAKDQSLEEFLATFDEIENNLKEITTRQDMVRTDTPDNVEMSKNVKDRIQGEIVALRTLIDESKEKVESLSKKLKNSNYKLAKFEKMVADLNEQLTNKETELTGLNEQLATLNKQVETLDGKVANLTEKDSVNTNIIDNQVKKLNTAYVAVGDYKKLNEKKVVTKEGGFLGLGKEEKLSAQFNKEAFSKVDITQLSNIPLNTKEAKLVTVHPEGSYTLKEQNDKVSELVITDPNEFWSASKYLVVMTK